MSDLWNKTHDLGAISFSSTSSGVLLPVEGKTVLQVNVGRYENYCTRHSAVMVKIQTVLWLLLNISYIYSYGEDEGGNEFYFFLKLSDTVRRFI